MIHFTWIVFFKSISFGFSCFAEWFCLPRALTFHCHREGFSQVRKKVRTHTWKSSKARFYRFRYPFTFWYCIILLSLQFLLNLAIRSLWDNNTWKLWNWLPSLNFEKPVKIFCCLLIDMGKWCQFPVFWSILFRRGAPWVMNYLRYRFQKVSKLLQVQST